jgi:acyl CoA:acetate/3-ketoacid CoA transferase
MFKCAVPSCKNQVIGGVQEIIEAGTLHDHDAHIPGAVVAWCEEHFKAAQKFISRPCVRNLTLHELQAWH